MNRKKLINKEKFIFNETEFVNPLKKCSLADRSSAQRRLFSKAEMNKPSFNPPMPSPPYTPIRSTRVYEMGLGGDYNSNDPRVEEVVAKLEKLDTESRSTNLPINTGKNYSNKIPNQDRQVVFDPSQAYHKSSDTSEKNSVMNHVEFKDRSILIGREHPTLSLKPPVMSKPAAPLSPPLSPKDEAMKQEDGMESEIPQVQNASCICMRPLKLILCPVCSNTTTGRIRKTCQVHPKAVYLLDIDACPRCKETKFILKEYELPEGFKQVKDRINEKYNS